MDEKQVVTDLVILVVSGLISGYMVMNRKLIRPYISKSKTYNYLTLQLEHYYFHSIPLAVAAITSKYLGVNPDILKQALPIGLGLASLLYGIKQDVFTPMQSSRKPQYDQFSADALGALSTFLFLKNYF